MHIMTNLGTVHKICCQQKAVFDWKIENFSSHLDELKKDSHTSHDFNFCGSCWYLELVYKKERSEGYIGLCLQLNSMGILIEVQCSFGIKNAKRKIEVKETITFNTLHNYSDDKGPVKLIDISELFRQGDELLPKDVLTLRVTLKMEREVALIKDSEDVSVQTEVEVDREVKPSKNTGGEKVLQDIVNLWTNSEHCDVLFKVGDEEFKAHKTILAARTPVMCAMFQHNTVERTTGEVTIDDCEPAVFEQLLHYIYTGALRELTAENAAALYVLADKYLFGEVKVLCVQCMQDTLCLDTFCKTVQLSLMHREDELRKVTTDFLSRNMIRVMKNVEWQRFMHEHTTWANEILICAMELIEARSQNELFVE